MALEVRVASRLGDFALDAEFSCENGVAALFGPSGSGKSTLVDLIAGLRRAEHGRIALGGRVLFDSASGVFVPAHRRRLGYVFQEARLFPHMTVRNNLSYGRRWAPRGAAVPDFGAVVALLDLAPLLDRRPATLSGGERQRVAIGRALLAGPEALLMDEPLASLDAGIKAQILPFLERLRDEVRLPIVYVSHQFDEVVRLADSLVLMAGGRVAAHGKVSEILARPDLRAHFAHQDAGRLITCRIEQHSAEYHLTTLAFADARLVVPLLAEPVGAAIRVQVRPRDVSVALSKPEGLSVQNVWRGTIEDIWPVGAEAVELAIRVGDTAIAARVTRKAVADLGLKPGLSVYALVKTVAVDRRFIAGVAHAEPGRG